MTHEDHVVFGWILFGIAMLLMYWIGARWREDHREDTTVWSPAARPAVGPMVTVIIAASMSVIAWPVLANALTRATGSPSPVAIATPQPAGGWVADPAPLSFWNAELEGESARRTFVFRKGTQRVALLVAVYRNQSQDAQVGSSVNQLVHTTDNEWRQTARAVVITGTAEDSGVADPVQVGELLATRRGERLLVWQWYWAGGRNRPAAPSWNWRVRAFATPTPLCGSRFTRRSTTIARQRSAPCRNLRATWVRRCSRPSWRRLDERA